MKDGLRTIVIYIVRHMVIGQWTTPGLTSMSSKRAVKEYYSTISAGYDELYGEEQSAKFGEVLKLIRFEWDDVVLDVGCGTGLITKRIGDGVGRVVGVDISREMVERGRHVGLELLVCDAESLPFRQRAFDKVFSFTVLQNLADPSKALGEMGRACHGIMALTVLKVGWSPQRVGQLVGRYLSTIRVLELEKDFLCIGSVRSGGP